MARKVLRLTAEPVVTGLDDAVAAADSHDVVREGDTHSDHCQDDNCRGEKACRPRIVLSLFRSLRYLNSRLRSNDLRTSTGIRRCRADNRQRSGNKQQQDRKPANHFCK